MSALAILTKCPLANCPLTKCPLANCHGLPTPDPFLTLWCLEPGKVVTRLPGPAEHSQHCLQSGGGRIFAKTPSHPINARLWLADWPPHRHIPIDPTSLGVTLRLTLIVAGRTILRTQIRINFNTLGLFLKHLDYLYICVLDTTPGTRSVWSLYSWPVFPCSAPIIPVQDPTALPTLIRLPSGWRHVARHAVVLIAVRSRPVPSRAVRSRPDTVRSRLDTVFALPIKPRSQMLRELPFGENILEVFRQNGESKFLLTSEWKWKWALYQCMAVNHSHCRDCVFSGRFRSLGLVCVGWVGGSQGDSPEFRLCYVKAKRNTRDSLHFPYTFYNKE